METFPLTRLPESELQQVLLKLTPIQLINLSTLSKKSKENIKKLPKQKWLRLEIDTQYSYEINIVNRNSKQRFLDYASVIAYNKTREDREKDEKRIQDSCCNRNKDNANFDEEKHRKGREERFERYEKERIDRKRIMTFDGVELNTVGYDFTIYAFYESHIKTLLFMAEYICDLFNFSSIYKYNLGEESPEERQIIIDWIKNKKSLQVKNCQITKYREKPVEEDFNDVFYLNIRSFTSYSADWFTLDQLLKMNSKYIRLYGPKLTNEDMSTFINHWLDGGCSNLVYLELRVKGLQILDILNEIDHDWSVSTENEIFTKRYLKFSHHAKKESIPEGFDVIRNDNATATIIQDQKDGERFEMIVWSEKKL